MDTVCPYCRRRVTGRLRGNQTLELKMAPENAEVVEVGGKGDCLFRSVSDQLYGTPEHHRYVRQACVDYMRTHKDSFESMIQRSQMAYPAEKQRSFEVYLRDMEKQGTWGGEAELAAISRLYKKPYTNISEGEDGKLRNYIQFEEYYSRPIQLFYVGDRHYQSVHDSTWVPANFLDPPPIPRSVAIAQQQLMDQQVAEQAQLEAVLEASRHHGTGSR